MNNLVLCEQQEETRDVWERPALRRLMANAAESGNGPLDDGNCVGGNAQNHSLCLGR
jgi:hypothetical protein